MKSGGLIEKLSKYRADSGKFCKKLTYRDCLVKFVEMQGSN
jgi:hypothetical protein